MARGSFGGTSADFVQDDRGNRKAGRTGTVWTAQTGGTQITDLLNSAGDPVTVATSASHPLGLVQFEGPDDGTKVVWVDFGDAGRVKLVADPTATYIAVVDEVTGTYPARPDGSACVVWRGTTEPAAADEGDIYINTGA